MFKKNDKVKVFYDNEQQFGIVETVNDESVDVYLFDEYEIVTFKKEDVTPLKDVFINYNDFEKFACFEKNVYDFIEDNKYVSCIVNKDNYKITVFDLLAVLDKIEKNKISTDEFYRQWFCYFDTELKKTQNLHSESFCMVPMVGVEPTRYRYHGILSPARLPILKTTPRSNI